MARTFDDLFNALSQATASGKLVEAYEAELQEDVQSFGERTTREPTEENIAHWLELYSLVADLSLDGAPDITQELYSSDPNGFRGAIGALSAAARQNALDFIDGLDAPEVSMEAMEEATAAAFPALTSSARAVDRPVLATFSATESIDTGRVRLYRGTLTVSDRNGGVTGRYSATTGGFVADYRRKNGPTPPGYFVVGNYRPDRGNTPGMRRNGVSYSFDLDEVRRTGDRGAFRIHPDGAPPGTHGCVGVAEDAATLRDCASKLADALRGGRFLLAVAYGTRPVPTA
jgi:hypothetical protein